MYSLVKKVVTSIIPWASETLEGNLKCQENKVFYSIDSIASENENRERAASNEIEVFGQSDSVKYDVYKFECIKKIGKITRLDGDCGSIDNVLYFHPSQVKTGLTVAVDDEVLYRVYKDKHDHTERMCRIYALKNDPWVTESEEDAKTKEVLTMMRCVTGRVTRKHEREIFIESVNVWCNLDKIQASFIPVEGDWVELSAAVAINKDFANLAGDIVHVKSLKPLLMKSGFGRVTSWSKLRKEGTIENSIYFKISYCEVGYIPRVGDDVVYDAVESDQDRLKWRALTVLVNNLKKKNKSAAKNKPKCSPIYEFEDPFCDRNDVKITPSVCEIAVELGQTKTVKFKVTNNGTVVRHIVRIVLQLGRRSQLKMTTTNTEGYSLLPQDTLVVEFSCEGKNIGLSGEVVIFYFRGFQIAKRFEINVQGNKEMRRFLECKFDTEFRVYKGSNMKTERPIPDSVSYGPRPWKPRRFGPKEQKLEYTVPKKLWELVKLSLPEAEYKNKFLEYAPYLKTDLCFENYEFRFHTLLYQEEIQLRVHFQKYDMTGVYLQQQDDYFVIEVPGLAEKRPSIIVGDKINLTQPWCDSEKIAHVGFVHDIRAKEIFVKFHNSFHRNYNNGECNITFEPGITFFSKCHEAITRAVRKLGKNWLFPSAVNEKPHQVCFTTSEEDAAVKETVNAPKNEEEIPGTSRACELSQIESSLNSQKLASGTKVKNLKWINKSLNARQKLAVTSVLRGQGRPLPYLIFGPPGTGKTVTLVETILQIYRLIPDSRILITTPSNSSADLICERLITWANFKPGQIVRLLAIYRAYEGRVSEKLVPYSTFHSSSETRNKEEIESTNRHNIKGSSFAEVAGMHRITVATCVTIGTLHYEGLPVGHFTHIVVDEAGQTTEPEVLIAASFQDPATGQIILAGDPQQLGPTVCSKLSNNFGLGVSLLERLISIFPYVRDPNSFPETSGYDPRFITKLNINYRTVPEILALPSQLFYNEDLIPTVSQTDGVEADLIKKFNFEAEDRDTPPAIIFHGVVGQNHQELDSPSWYNPHEIWQVVIYIRKLYSLGLTNNDLGIVSPYAKQVHKLKVLLSSLELSAPKIGSVEEFQGQERQVIILTTVRSSTDLLNSDVVHSLGFVASPKRLNVALTRARALLIIVGNPFLLSKDHYWVSVVKYCMKNNSFTGCNFEIDTSEEKEEK